MIGRSFCGGTATTGRRTGPRRIHDGHDVGVDRGPVVARPLLNLLSAMDDQSLEIVNVRLARRLLTDGDIKSEVAFQHDVNRLLAALDDLCDRADESQIANS